MARITAVALALSLSLLSVGCDQVRGALGRGAAEVSERASERSSDSQADRPAERLAGNREHQAAGRWTTLAETTDLHRPREEREPGPSGVDGSAAPAPGERPAAPPTESRVEIADLLDLVPAGSTSFIALRDPNAAGRMLDAVLRGADQDALATIIPQWDPTRGAEAAAKVASVESWAEGTTLRPEAGVVVLPEDGVVLFGGAHGDTALLNETLAKLLPEGSEGVCGLLPKLPGFVGCSVDEAALSSLEAGGRGATLRAELAGALPGVDLEASNLLMKLRADEDTVMGAVSTRPGRVYGAFGGAAFGELGTSAKSGPAEALGLFAPGAPVVWTRIPPALFAVKEEPLRAVSKTLTGEFALGGLRDGSLGVVAGVKDPFPVTGLIPMALLKPDRILAALPAGATLDSLRFEADEGPISALRLEYVDGPVHDFAERFELQSKVLGFAAGDYAAIVAGGTERTAETLAHYRASRAVPAWLPLELRRALEARTCVMAMHLPLDSLHETDGRELFLSAFELAGGLRVVAPARVNAALHAMAPLSSVSSWLTVEPDGAVLHFAGEFFGYPHTSEGVAALVALAEIVEGSQPATTYGALAEAHTEQRFSARARSTPATRSASLLAGLVSGLAVDPSSFSKARRRTSSRRTAPRKKKRGARVSRRSFAQVRANGIYTPGPDARKLKAAARTAGKGIGRVSFCVARGGKAEDVKTSKRYRGGTEREVDKVLVDTVKRWRFKPFFVGGSTRKVCTVATFNIDTR